MVSVSYGHGTLYDFESTFLFKNSQIYTATGAGAGGGTTTVIVALTQADDYWNGCYIKCLTASNTDNVGEIKEVTDFTDVGDVVTHDAFTAQTLTGDTFQISLWGITEDGQTFSTPNSTVGDYLLLNVSGSAGNKDGYISYPNESLTNNISISTIVYPKIRIRYMTGDTNIKAKVTAVYSDASTSVPLDQTSSITMTTTDPIALTAGKTLDHLRFHAEEATGDVYYDFALVYAGDFTFPNGAYGITGEIPTRHSRIEIPTRQSSITQMLGSGDFPVNIGCDLTKGTWTRSGDVVSGQVFYDIAYNAGDEAFQWLDTETEQFKVTLDPPRFRREASGMQLINRVDLSFKEYRLSTGDNALESYVTRWGLNL